MLTFFILALVIVVAISVAWMLMGMLVRMWTEKPFTKNQEILWEIIGLPCHWR